MSKKKGSMKKVYVVCGDIRLVKLCEEPLDACHAALGFKSDKHMLGSHFYIDERGFRDADEEPQWTVPVEKLFAEAGPDSYGDLDDDPQGGTLVPVGSPDDSGSPSAQV